MNIGERIKKRRLELQMSVEEVAKIIGKNRAIVYRYESNEIENFPLSVLKPISKALNCSQEYLMGWTDDPYNYEIDEEKRMSLIPSDILTMLLNKHNGSKSKAWEEWWNRESDALFREMDQEDIKASSKAHRIPVLGDVAAGIPIEMIEDIIDYEEIPANWGSKEDFFCLQIKGDSMQPKIDEGDVVVVRKQADAETGDTVIFTVNGDTASCKRLRKTENGLMFIPLNKDYDPIVYSWDEVADLPVRILGKVVELRAKF